jgi:ABC-type nitrate/sulfonate/bicarbonate transport system permease component
MSVDAPSSSLPASPENIRLGEPRGQRIVRRPRPERRGAQTLERALSVLTPLLLLALWELLARVGVLDERFFPAPTSIASTGWDLLSDGSLVSDMSTSLRRAAVGFLLGALPGLLIGMSIGLNRFARAALQPLVDALYPIPKLAIIPLVLLVFGLGESSKYVIIATDVFFQLAITTAVGVRAIDKVYFDVARSFGAGRLARFRTVVVPGAMPVVVAGVRLGWGVALLLVIAAEMVAANSGLGYLIWNAWQTFQVERMYVGLIVIAAIALVSFRVLGHAEKRVLHWRPDISA